MGKFSFARPRISIASEKRRKANSMSLRLCAFAGDMKFTQRRKARKVKPLNEEHHEVKNWFGDLFVSGDFSRDCSSRHCAAVGTWEGGLSHFRVSQSSGVLSSRSRGAPLVLVRRSCRSLPRSDYD